MTTRATETAVPAAGTARIPHNKPLGELLVQLGYLCDSELEEILRIQRAERPGSRRSIGRICVDLGFLSKDRLQLILDRFGKRLRLGELLVNRGRLTTDQVDEALEHQTRNGGRFGAILIEKGYIDAEGLTETLAEQYDLAFFSLRDVEPQPELRRYVNATYAEAHQVAPVSRSGRRLTVAAADPTRGEIVHDLEQSTGLEIQLVLAVPGEVAAYNAALYGSRETSAPSAAERVEAPATAPRTLGGNGNGSGAASPDGALRAILTRAHALQAVDVRFSTDPAQPTLWLRSDRSEAYEPFPSAGPDRELLRGCVRVLKERARLDVRETSRPQEGPFTFRSDEGDFSREIAACATTFPGHAGEEAHVHLLRPGGVAPWALDAGVRDSRRRELSALVSHGRGVLLIAGPAGSGKRRMLRFVQHYLKAQKILVHAVEESVLERNPGVVQATAEPHTQGKDYAGLVEAFTAHGTDAILVDRLEDAAAARAVFSRAGSGPLFVCGITAASATHAIERLEGLGIDRDILAEHVLASMGLRLLRRVCPRCTANYRPRRAVLGEWFSRIPSGIAWQRGTGCLECAGLGFEGRVLASELWLSGPGMRRAILESKHGSVLRDAMLRHSRGSGEDALRFALEGCTTLEEALKAIPYEDVALTRTRVDAGCLERD